ncbi:helix-turn-helix domain-containing protein [Marinibacterium sp. SX1]|uniref:helix-turn-helix domain-containing protein n=1 Tax=Marinibacterium sp. SX1 TaxID=3388424 RepID=UPI003D17EE9E
MRVISSEQWRDARFQWLEAVRRDRSLTTTVRLVAHSLALDFAHHRTGECYPSAAAVGRDMGLSTDTVKRAFADLVAAGWISRVRGGAGGRGKAAEIQFLSKARIVAIKRGTGAPVSGRRKGGADAPVSSASKGGAGAPVSRFQRGAPVREKGGTCPPPYIEPYFNHRGPAADLDAKSEFWEGKILAGSFIPQNAITRAVVERIRERGLVGDDVLKRKGLI